jgi:hypothetical protein
MHMQLPRFEFNLAHGNQEQMRITRTIKVLLILSLVFVMIISYVINISSGQFQMASSPIDRSTKSETADEYNKRKKEEIAQRKKAEKTLKNKKAEYDQDQGRKSTVDGYDPSVGDIIDPINLWENYQTRTYAGKLRHGEIVTLIRREGDGVLIEKNSGLRGWVTYFFIKEFNDEAKKRGDK